MLVKKLQKNNKGRDLVVGDIHGMYNHLQQALKLLGFDPEQGDRLISVGDLIDRGNKNLECLSLLDEEWFHMVIGNHEQFALYSGLYLDDLGNFMRGSDTVSAQMYLTWMGNGGGWIHKLDLEQKQKFLTYIKLLENEPYVLCVGEGADRYNVVHAELSLPAFSISDEFLDKISTTEKYSGPHNLDYFLDRACWGRSLIQQYRAKAYTNDTYLAEKADRSITYCGHSVVLHPVKTGNHIYLDGGICFFDTMVNKLFIADATNKVMYSYTGPKMSLEEIDFNFDRVIKC